MDILNDFKNSILDIPHFLLTEEEEEEIHFQIFLIE